MIVDERYERLSVRGVVNDDPDFVWCSGPNCEDGQYHEGGAASPIVSCNSCGFRTCFVHQEPWHEGATCGEYDALGEDPDRALSDANGMDGARDEVAERDRREAERFEREEWGRPEERSREEERKPEERRQEEEGGSEKCQRYEQARQAANRCREEAASRQLVSNTTKPCPGCGFAIEKNSGCDHMTCTYTSLNHKIPNPLLLSSL
jgi:hypothetical protein